MRTCPDRKDTQAVARNLRSAKQQIARMFATPGHIPLRRRLASAKATCIGALRAFGLAGTVARLNTLELRLADEMAARARLEQRLAEETAERKRLEQRVADETAERKRHDQELFRGIAHLSRGTYVFPVSDAAIAEACSLLSVANPVRHDTGGRTAHARVTMSDGCPAWLKVSGLSCRNNDPCRAAEIESAHLTGLAKPDVLRSVEWQRDGVYWRAVLMDVAPSPAVARHPWCPSPMVEIPDRWFDDLRAALQGIQAVSTSRYIYAPDEIRDLIKSYLPAGMRTEADVWCTQHGDLHWSNITAPSLTLLDWEVWGLAPLGYGPGRLLVFSLLQPALARRLETLFADQFCTPSGEVGLLAAIAVVRQQIESGGVPKAFEIPIAALIERIRNQQLGGIAQDRHSSSRDRLLDAIRALPEAYQPLFGHPELSTNSLRSCEDRLRPMMRICSNLRQLQERPLRILDLGCAQGYISFRLAECGDIVTAIDNHPKNIAVCNALLWEHPKLNVTFHTTTVGDVIERIAPGDFDIVLGLSVLHHLCHDHGKAIVASWLEKLANRIRIGIFETALQTETAYWASALPADMRELLGAFAHVHEVGRFRQPSGTFRPLYCCAREPLELTAVAEAEPA